MPTQRPLLGQDPPDPEQGVELFAPADFARVLVLPVALGFVRELIVDRRPEGWASSLRLMASRKQGRWIHLEAVLE